MQAKRPPYQCKNSVCLQAQVNMNMKTDYLDVDQSREHHSCYGVIRGTDLPTISGLHFDLPKVERLVKTETKQHTAYGARLDSSMVI